jgi:hypothetical protein
LNNYTEEQVEGLVRNWMHSGFMKPGDLAKKAKINEKSLVYLPFWVVSINATTKYKGIFERISPAIVKEGQIQKEYNWLVLAKEASIFPTREYNVPLTGKIPYDFRRIEVFAKLLNSEITREEALEIAKQQIDTLHRFLLKQEIDRIVEATTMVNNEQTVYLHAPVWFIKYEYKGNSYQMIVDGAMGMVLKGDIPSSKF